MATEHARFTEPQQRAVDEIVEGRLNRERRLHEREREAERESHRREVAALKVQLEQARAERSVVGGLLQRWFSGSPRESGR